MVQAPNGFDGSYDLLSLLPDVMLREVWAQAVWTAKDMPANAAANIRYANSKGKVVGGGIAINTTHNASWHYNAARALPSDAWDMLDFRWLDLEEPANGVQPADIDQMLDLIGQRIIYTRREWWESQTQLAGYDPKALLWDARYATGGIVPAFVPYGPWTSEEQVCAVQTHGGYQVVPGLAVDDDVFRLEMIVDAPTKQEFQNLFALTVAVRDALLGLAGYVQRNVQADAQQQAEIDAIEQKLAATK